MTLMSKVGGASGPLYGSAFLAMSKTATETLDTSELIYAGLEAIQKKEEKLKSVKKNDG